MPGIIGVGVCISIEKALELDGLKVEKELDVPVVLKNEPLGIGFRMDLLVSDKVVVEVKSVKAIEEVHKKQLLTYLKLSDKKLGLLVNFNTTLLKDGESMFRIINGSID